jgi:hypothetical protein
MRLRPVKELPTPPATRTLPSRSSVAVCLSRAWLITPAGDQVFVAGSYSSALASGLPFRVPPAISTLPFGSSVAVWRPRVWGILTMGPHSGSINSASPVASTQSSIIEPFDRSLTSTSRPPAAYALGAVTESRTTPLASTTSTPSPRCPDLHMPNGIAWTDKGLVACSGGHGRRLRAEVIFRRRRALTPRRRRRPPRRTSAFAPSGRRRAPRRPLLPRYDLGSAPLPPDVPRPQG